MKYIIFFTPEYDFDLGSGSAEERMTYKEFMSNNCCVNNNTLGRSAIVSCEDNFSLLSSAVFYVVRVVYKFVFRLVVNCTRNKQRAMESERSIVRDQYFARVYNSSLQNSHGDAGNQPYCQGQSFAPEQTTVHRHNHQISATVHCVVL